MFRVKILKFIGKLTLLSCLILLLSCQAQKAENLDNQVIKNLQSEVAAIKIVNDPWPTRLTSAALALGIVYMFKRRSKVISTILGHKNNE